MELKVTSSFAGQKTGFASISTVSCWLCRWRRCRASAKLAYTLLSSWAQNSSPSSLLAPSTPPTSCPLLENSDDSCPGTWCLPSFSSLCVGS